MTSLFDAFLNAAALVAGAIGVRAIQTHNMSDNLERSISTASNGNNRIEAQSTIACGVSEQGKL